MILLADHDPETHQTRFAFAQHYFTVPFANPDHGEGKGASKEGEDHKVTALAPAETALDPYMMKMWYVSTPFDVVYVNDSIDEDGHHRSRPLVAVDFGHAVWVEHCDNSVDGEDCASERLDGKCLRFVTFPPVGEENPADQEPTQGVVRTLEVPEELDLDTVETINIDQSQGAVILSNMEGKIFFLFYS